MDNWTYLIALAVAVASAFICARIAGGKGRNPIGYAILGFVLPLVGIVVAVVIPRKNV